MCPTDINHLWVNENSSRNKEEMEKCHRLDDSEKITRIRGKLAKYSIEKFCLKIAAMD